VRIRDLIHRFESDPLLKVGAVAMTVALAFAVVVAVAAAFEKPIEPAVAKSEVKSTTEPLVRSDPGFDPWVEEDIPPPRPSATPSSSSSSQPNKQPNPDLERQFGVSQSLGSLGSAEEPGSGDAQDQGSQSIPLGENDYPLPTSEQLQSAHQPRHYHLPAGAIMSLTVGAMGLNNVPVLNSDSTRALDMGVVHLPDTSLPWSNTPERNVYLAGHRLGWPGTGSHLVFYRLNELQGGERITLRDRQGNRYDYRVIQSFTVGPEDDWVTGRVKGRDLLTLQTCTPIPTFHRRLIVRAERI
jgi:sortase A